MYYWQNSENKPFTPEGDWDSERQKYGSYDGKIAASVTELKPATTLELEIKYGIRNEVINRRLKKGWNEYDAINTPLQQRRHKQKKSYYIGCVRMDAVEFANYIGLTYSQLNYRLRRGNIAKTHWQESELADLIESWEAKEA